MRLPDTSHRLAVIGRTGTGKTQAAAWFLSQQPIEHMPWLVFDWKGDKLLNDIRAKEIEVGAPLPKKPGVFIVRPTAVVDDDAVTKMLWAVHKRGSMGVYIDEGYMVGDENPAFRALLTQGRSKNIPMITLSQRPFHMDRFAFSEADFYLVFNLNDRKDQQRVGEFLHRDIDLRNDIPKYHGWYHDVSEAEHTLLSPVPSATKIKAIFRSKIGAKRRLL